MQLSDTLTAAQKGVSALATCSTQARGCCSAVDAYEDEEPKAMRLCGGSMKAVDLDGSTPAGEVIVTGSGNEGAADAKLRQGMGDIQASGNVAQSTNLKRARNLAVSMASRAAVLARELKNIKSELHFMQERCGLLEEENKWLRDDNGVAPEEDDMYYTRRSARRRSKAQRCKMTNAVPNKAEHHQ